MVALHNVIATSIAVTNRLSSLGYSGEHFDAKAQQQYLRARFYNPSNGRFNRLDPFIGNNQDPQSLHKYAYVHGDPIGIMDPTGEFGLAAKIATVGIGSCRYWIVDQLFDGYWTRLEITKSRLNQIQKHYEKNARINGASRPLDRRRIRILANAAGVARRRGEARRATATHPGVC